MTPCLSLPLRTQAEARAEVAAKRAMLALVKLSPTMAAINRAVEQLPPLPLGAPLPIMGTADQYADAPCSTPQRRRGYPSYNRVCMCGYEMSGHRS